MATDVPAMWRTPSGDASATAFASAREIVDAAIAATELALDADSGDAAARRATALVRRLRDTPDEGPPLVRALRRWRLDETSTRLVLALIAAELSPAVLARATPAGITVELAARMLGDVATIAGALAPGRPLADLALVTLRGGELPLPRRVLAVAPRVVDIALGAAGLDRTTGAYPIAPAPEAAAELVERARSLGGGTVGVVRGGRAALPVLARAFGELLAVELSLLADEGRARAIARDAVFLGAALAIVVDIGARDLPRAARVIERLAGQVPVLVAGGMGELLPGVPAIELDVPAPTRDELRTAVASAFADVLDAAEVEELAAGVPRDLGAIARAATALHGRELPLARAASVRRAVIEQLVPLDGGLPRADAGADLPPLPAALAAPLEEVARRWRAGPRRLHVLICGRPGAGKTSAAAHLARELDLPALIVDVPRLLRGPEHDPALATAAAAAAVGAAVLVVENAELIGVRRPGRPTAEPTFPAPWLARCDGLVVITTADNLTAVDVHAKRELDDVVVVPSPGEPERAAIWSWHAARRGWVLSPAELARLASARLGPAQIARIVAHAARDALPAEIERRALLVAGRAGAEID